MLVIGTVRSRRKHKTNAPFRGTDSSRFSA
jgi:hypothetical protein